MFNYYVITVYPSLMKPRTAVYEYSIKARQIQFKQGLCQAVTTAVSKKTFSYTCYNMIAVSVY